MTSPWQFDQTPASATPGPSGGPGLPGYPGAGAAGDDVPDSWWQAARGDVAAGGIVLGVCLLVGAAAGAIWFAIAPEIPKVVVDHAEYLRPSAGTESEVARDGWFAVIAVIVGLLLGGLAFWKGRKYGIGVAVGLGVGGLLGSYVAYKVGAALGPDTFGSELVKRDGRIEFEEPLRIQAKGVLYLWPMASLILFLILNAAFGPRDKSRKQMAWPPRQDAYLPPNAAPQPTRPPAPGDVAQPPAAGPDLTKRPK
ncbi:MAG: hypothetical protein HOV68_20115 [Streptomycetaceae bacterium]|nr:hypothetical protein [Streptomycetaceae bacterium]